MKRKPTTKTTTAPDRLLDVTEAAVVLGCTPATLYQWSRERRIASVKLMGSLRFRLSTLMALIEKSERPAVRPLHERRRA